MNLSNAQATKKLRTIALVGNPNCGKTTLFNALTGLRQKVGNYPGVTVEKKEGHLTFSDGAVATLIDLPGTYSLAAKSPDEQVTADIILGRSPHVTPDLMLCVVDASNIERNLYLVSQIIDRQIPLVIALNMIDVAERENIKIDIRQLEDQLGICIIPTVASTGAGMEELKSVLAETTKATGNHSRWKLPGQVHEEYEELVGLLQEQQNLPPQVASHEAIALLTSNNTEGEFFRKFKPEVLDHVRKDHQKLDFLGFDRQSVFIESRYDWIKSVCYKAIQQPKDGGTNFSDKIDRIVTHRVWGYLVFMGLMALMFHAVFTWATVPMDLIGDGFNWIGRQITTVMPAGDLRDLMVNGALGGVAAVVTFLPQILLLFLFLGFLEDTGYMARAAFIMDRMMSKVGLHGRSFIPLLSSFACAIPGIMATRTIENPKDRLVTMLVAPLIGCSARLPVYTLLIAAFIPGTLLFGFLSLPGITLFAMYLLGLVAALTMAWLFKKTLLKGSTPTFIMELPPYRMPSLKTILIQMWERSWLFLKRAGTFILGVSIILWFLATYPRLENSTPSDQLKHSFAGKTGQFIEPLIKPLGFDWKIGIGLVSSILQREVFVSTMGTIYNIQNNDINNGTLSLREQLQQDRDPVTGKPTFTVLTALCLMVYYVLAMQCLSTVAVMRRETNGWKWPAFQMAYMTALAYSVTFLVYRAGLWFGVGA